MEDGAIGAHGVGILTFSLDIIIGAIANFIMAIQHLWFKNILKLIKKMNWFKKLLIKLKV